MSMAYYADGHSGTVTTANLPDYNEGADVSAGGAINDDGTGSITASDLTFKHVASSNIHSLNSNGDVSSP